MCGRNLGNLLSPALAGVLAEKEVLQKRRSDAAIPQLNQMKTCSSCQANISSSFVWCPHCGQALRAHPCAYCGRLLKPDEHNCPSCGAPGNKR